MKISKIDKHMQWVVRILFNFLVLFNGIDFRDIRVHYKA